MKTSLPFCLALLIIATASRAAEPAKTRLFVLSGQSNMAGLNPDVSFTPAIKAAFPGDDIIVVKSAQGGQPIRRWYKDWKAPASKPVQPNAKDAAPPKHGDLYDVLIKAVREKLGDKKPNTVSFVWMQGERDAKENLSGVYADSLRGLVAQLKKDLMHGNITVVIGRLSDNQTTAEWNAMRDIQVKFGDTEPRSAWVDTDDLNGDKNGLHYTKEGYTELGRRFAAKTVALLNGQ